MAFRHLLNSTNENIQSQEIYEGVKKDGSIRGKESYSSDIVKNGLLIMH